MNTILVCPDSELQKMEAFPLQENERVPMILPNKSDKISWAFCLGTIMNSCSLKLGMRLK